MKALITGINGFIGGYLAKHLHENGFEVCGTSRQKNESYDFEIYNCDLIDYEKTYQIIKSSKPDLVFHLAAQSNIPYSFDHPQETINTNVNGTLNLLEAIRLNQLNPVFISVGSSAEYGKLTSNSSILSEDSPTNPSSPYAVSKLTQKYFVELYSRSYGLKTVHVRPFAIIGPGKKGDAVSDFARGIVEIEKGKKKELLVGNLTHTRDFIDVRDAVEALSLISEKGTHSIYNICSGQGIKLQDILNKLIKLSKAEIVVKQDPGKSRPADDPIIAGNPGKLNSLGFKQKYSIDQVLTDTLNYWRQNISQEI